MKDNNNIKLTKYTKFSGCGAKFGPGMLDKALCGIEYKKNPNLIVSFEHAEDSGVYKISEDIAIVQSTDFFPPIVDDPYIFGQIAACNALSDIYAMGASPITALSLVCFPVSKIDISILRKIMQGGISKLNESETSLVGGHSIEDDEIKYGLAVTGTVHPKKILLNNTPQPDEKIILTKPIGTGLINTALKADLASKRAIDSAISGMTTLNKKAAEIAVKYNASACTDVTGFGLAGHSCEMICESNVGFIIDFKKIPLHPDVIEYCDNGLIPAGTYRNRDYRSKFIIEHDKLPYHISDLLFDPQTSGGLLFTVKTSNSEKALNELINHGLNAEIIGETTIEFKEKIKILY